MYRHAESRPDIPDKLRSAFWLTLAVVLFLISSFAETGWSATQTNPDEAQAGSFYFKDDNGATWRAVHVQSDVSMNIKGMTNSVTLTQEFTNASDRWVEGMYVFPLPDDSAVHYMRMKIGGRTIVGQIKEKAEAKKIYRQAKNEGRKAALVEQERPNIFTQSVANIGPGESITVELRYLQPVRYNAGRFSLRFPMTLTPRFIPGAPLRNVEQSQARTVDAHGWALATDEVPDAFRITPKYLPPASSKANPVKMSIRLEAGLPLADIRSVSHTLDIKQVRSGQDFVHEIRFAGQTVPMDRDFELEWMPENGRAPAAAVFHEQVGEDSFVQLMLLPPQVDDQVTPLPRELILIIDTSGSMDGPSIVQAKKSVELALRRLTVRDRFNIIEFNSDYTVLFGSPVIADAHNIAQALDFVRALQANGGTNMAPALSEALNSQDDENYLRQMVFITDGSVGNEASLFALIKNRLGGARLFTVGIGSAPNSFFMRKAAQFGRGTFTHIGSIGQVSERMGELFDKLQSPAMAGLQIDWPASAEVDMYPQRVPDLYLGEPLSITARLHPPIDQFNAVTVAGTLQGQRWERQLKLPAPAMFPPLDETEAARQPRSGLATIWARRKIEDLLDNGTAGTDPSSIRTSVLGVALPYQLMSPYTSFVAVEKQASRPGYEALASRAVLNHLPEGQSAPPVMYPSTATPATLRFVIGLVMLLLAGVLSVDGGWRFTYPPYPRKGLRRV